MPESIGDRLKKVAIERFGSVAGMARALGVKQQELDYYAANRSKPGPKWQERLRKAGIDIEWLMTGITPNLPRETAPIVMVPFLGKIAATPEGKLYFDDEVPRGATVPFFRTNHGELFALEVENDSLVHAQPEEIHPGDICIFCKDEQPKDGEVVAVQLKQNNDRMVKIYKRISKRDIELLSANRFRNYLPRKVGRDEIASLAVYVGKITISEERKRRYGLRR